MTVQAEHGPKTRPLSAMDLTMMRYQQKKPATPVVGGYLLRVAGECGVDELRAAVLDRVRRFPELTERLMFPKGARQPVWGQDPDFDVSAVVREHTMADVDGEAGLRAFLERRYRAELPLDAPGWEIFLVPKVAAGEFAVFFRSSHVWLDGMAAGRVMGMLFGAGDAPDRALSPRRDGRPTPRIVLSAFRHICTWARPSGGLEALAGPLAGDVRLHWASTSTDRLRAIGRAYGATVNDVFLVALSEAFESWTRPVGPRRGLRALMPISARRPEEQELLGNFVMGTRVWLPSASDSPWRRFDEIRRQTAQFRAARAGVGERWWFERIPTRVTPTVVALGTAPQRVALSASNLGAMRGPLVVADRPVTAALPLPVLMPEQRVSVGLGGLAPTATLGIVADRGVPALESLADHWLASLEHLAKAAGLTSSPNDSPHDPVATPSA
ncbi:DUF1298 domain-containing protein [Frankia sp. CNm7]|uniref:DUF1298 domain-containing protein n=1 Tax=Frankia nepalensis TaxID=1836974 RepID=A0A937RM84_9ACTN|nr:wax ester/triacylglycerol synthase domain-containing protein [Frankia nepalensis]MBL7500495.1 DUF1298 domain-containing protein [Frankia nepalensis]MBL7511226.1 DUF1298 domain-containing protein [Frankia nepalensis]MBL7523364.1 DUF1298 domain-containing protein [Frankia nepalensis]MBL7631480.1 DUF1298 domain-containing protein [Frankia nepalensis]